MKYFTDKLHDENIKNNLNMENIYNNEIKRLSSILVGVHIDEARKKDLTPQYNSLRIVKFDGNYCVCTQDVKFDRINIVTEKNIITKIHSIG